MEGLNMLNGDVMALVVLYNPSISDLNNVLEYVKHIRHVLVIDNSKKSNDDFFTDHNCSNLQYLSFSENIGLSEAYNIAIENAIISNYNFILILDQDSRLNHKVYHSINNIFEKYQDSLGEIGIFALTPADVVLENTVFSIDSIIDNQVAISSGSIINVQIAKAIGGFDERFFIDAVDIEYSCNIMQNNYKIINFPKVKFEHEIGAPVHVNHLGCDVISTNHIPLRYYYLIRNNLLLSELYGTKDNDEFIRHIANVSKKDTLYKLEIVQYEPHRLLKYYYALLGMFHFSKSQFGKLSPDYMVSNVAEVVNILYKDHELLLYFLNNLNHIERAIHNIFIKYNKHCSEVNKKYIPIISNLKRFINKIHH